MVLASSSDKLSPVNDRFYNSIVVFDAGGSEVELGLMIAMTIDISSVFVDDIDVELFP